MMLPIDAPRTPPLGSCLDDVTQTGMGIAQKQVRIGQSRSDLEDPLLLIPGSGVPVIFQ